MNCANFEKLIALDLEGDLLERKANAVREHLKACGHCQEFAEKLKASQALLKSLAQESVDDAALQGIRERVWSKLGTDSNRQVSLAWPYALGAGLTAVAVLAALTLRHPSKGRVTVTTPAKPTQTVTEAVRQAPTLAHRTPVQVTKAGRTLHRREHFKGLLTASAKPQPSQQLTVKLVTDDPNVVIYWLVD